jgi:Flp pilus assembly protein TadG
MTGVGRPDRRDERGQALMEFAVVLPVFLVILLGMIDIGRGVWANNTVANAAREAARYASVHGGTKANTCPVGPPAEKTEIPPASSTCPFPSPSKDGIREVARSFTVAGGTGLTIQVCYGIDCSGDTDGTDAAGDPATNARGTPVTVTVSSQVPMIMGTFLGLGTINVSATSTMLVNH